MHSSFFIIVFLWFNISVNAQTKNLDTGAIEIIVKAVKDSLNTGTSTVKIEFYRTDNKAERLGLMVVVINGKQYLTDLEGNFEKHLNVDKRYDFKFGGTGYFSQKKSINIEKKYEYLIKVFMTRKQEMIVD